LNKKQKTFKQGEVSALTAKVASGVQLTDIEQHTYDEFLAEITKEQADIDAEVNEVMVILNNYAPDIIAMAAIPTLKYAIEIAYEKEIKDNDELMKLIGSFYQDSTIAYTNGVIGRLFEKGILIADEPAKKDK